MSMIYLDKQTYFDTDDLDDFDYSEFCRHRENLRKYYKYKDSKDTISKANILGIDIIEMINKAEIFIYENILGYSCELNLKQVIFNIANDVEG